MNYPLPDKSGNLCYKLVIDGVGTSTAQNVLSGFSFKAGDTVGLDMSSRQPGKFMVGDFRISPPATSPQFLEFISSLCKELDRVLYIPIIDYGFEVLSKSDFGKQVVMLISDPETIRLCDDKLEMSAFFDLDPNLPFKLPLDQRKIVVSASRCPLVIKPRRGGRASLDVFFTEDVLEAKRHIQHLGNNAYYQERVLGKEVTIDVLTDLSGNFVSYICRDRLEVKAGVCQKAYVYKDKRYEYIAKYLCKMLRFKGPFNAQFIETSNDFIYLIEINPRFSGGLNLSIAAGWNPVVPILGMVSLYFLNIQQISPNSWGEYIDRSFKEGYAYKTAKACFEQGKR
jgi:carbamoyl-phosphate synthase large subunit